MEWQDIVSSIGLYLLAIIFLFASYIVAYTIDKKMFKVANVCKEKKTVEIGWKWLFKRHKRDGNNEIFLSVFIQELIDIILFVLVTVSFILTLMLENQYIILIVSLASVGESCIYLIASNSIESKLKKKAEHAESNIKKSKKL